MCRGHAATAVAFPQKRNPSFFAKQKQYPKGCCFFVFDQERNQTPVCYLEKIHFFWKIMCYNI